MDEFFEFVLFLIAFAIILFAIVHFQRSDPPTKDYSWVPRVERAIRDAGHQPHGYGICFDINHFEGDQNKLNGLYCVNSYDREREERAREVEAEPQPKIEAPQPQVHSHGNNYDVCRVRDKELACCPHHWRPVHIGVVTHDVYGTKYHWECSPAS